MNKKYYAVKKGRVPGVYCSWNECKEQVDGFPGAVFKGFFAEMDAYNFVYNGAVNKAAISPPSTSESVVTIPEKELEFFIKGLDYAAENIIAYVDGSYDDATKLYASGVVIFDGTAEIHVCESYNDADMRTMRNVAGEIMAAEIAMRYAFIRGAESLTVYHDYEGIAKWCTGEWKARLPGTILYCQLYEIISNVLPIDFVHVQGHSGDVNNNKADALARSALKK